MPLLEFLLLLQSSGKGNSKTPKPCVLSLSGLPFDRGQGDEAKGWLSIVDLDTSASSQQRIDEIQAGYTQEEMFASNNGLLEMES